MQVGVVLLSSCQGVHAAETHGRQTDVLARMDAWNEVTAYGEWSSVSCPERIARVRTVGAWTDSS